MKNRLATAAIAAFALSLAACSSSAINSHPLPNPPSNPTVDKIALSFIGASPSRTQSGTYSLNVSAYQNGALLPTSTIYQYPIQLSSNASNYVSFATSGGASGTSTLAVPSASTPVYVVYTACAASPCQPLPPAITITATAPGVTTANVGVVSF